MTTKITEECINCGACESECPNVAIYAGTVEYEWQGVKRRALSDDFYYIVPEKCTECVGFFEREACAAACPVDCCIADPECSESEDVLIARARGLHPDKEFAREVPSRFRKAERSEPLPARSSNPAATSAAVVSTAGLAERGAVGAASEPVSAAGAIAESVVEAPLVTAAAAAAAAAPAACAFVPAPALAAVVVASPPARAVAAPTPTPKPPGASPPSRAPVESKSDAADGGSVPVRHSWRVGGTYDFEKLRDAVRASSTAQGSLLGRLARRFGRVGGRGNGSPGFDGFTSAAFESKRERERRYGEVYRVEEHPGGYYVRMELPRTVPPSAAKARLGIGDEMPDYDLDVSLLAPELTISGHVADRDLRALCGISSAFPPDFRTSIALNGKLSEVGYRYSDKVLEVVVSKHDGTP